MSDTRTSVYFTVEQQPGSDQPRGQRRKKRWLKVLIVTSTVLVLLIVILGAIVIRRLNTPPAVLRSWSAPKALPISGASVPAGNLVFDSNRTGNFEIWTMGPNGKGETQLTDDPRYDSWWPQISPDRRTILFYRTPKGVHDRDYSKTTLWAVAANGANLEELRPKGLNGWVYQGHAEWSPDGAQIVMFGGSRSNPQIWVTNKLGQHPKQITDRGGSNIDPSWSPDGRTIAFSGCPSFFCSPGDLEIYTVPASGGKPERITNDSYSDNDPTFSHSGTELAWLTKMSTSPSPVGTWDIRTLQVVTAGSQVVAAPGAKPVLLLPDVPGVVNSKPEWSLDDNTIYFHRGSGDLRGGFQIWAVKADGTGLHELTTEQSGSNEYPTRN